MSGENVNCVICGCPAVVDGVAVTDHVAEGIIYSWPDDGAPLLACHVTRECILPLLAGAKRQCEDGGNVVVMHGVL